MSSLLQDLRYGARTLGRAPGFAAVAVLTLALGIGANTAIFTVVHALLLSPLPYPAADRLVMVWQDMTGQGGPSKEWATPGNLADWRSSGLFAGVTAMQGWQATLTGLGEAEALIGEQVTHDYFDVLGLPPLLGRTFRPEDDVPNAPRVVVLSHALWHRRFGGDAGIVGRTITLGGEAHEIIGVMPPQFRPGVLRTAEVWRPRRLDLANPSRGAVVLRVIARLKSETSIEATSVATSQLATRLAAQYPDSNAGVGILLTPLHTEVIGEVRTGLFVLLGAVGFVLLIACANIANLLLARASARTREVAVRVALGAGRGRLIRQLLTESLVLSTLGGIAGLLLGLWSTEALVLAAPRGTPRLDEIQLDGTVLLFTLALTIGTGLLFGLVPALFAARSAVAPALSDGARHASSASGLRARRALIVLEVATALVLLVGSGLLIRTLAHLQSSDLGFDPARVLVARVNPPRATYGTAQDLIALFDRLLERSSALPGLETAALTSIVPLGGDNDMDMIVEGRARPRPGSPPDAVWYRLISHDYFRAMGIAIAAGRSFEAREAAPAVIVSDITARRFWGQSDPIGRRVRFSDRPEAPWFTVVGIAREVKMRGPRGDSRSEIYLPYWQFPEPGINIVLKSQGDPDLLAAPLRAAVREIDPDLALSGLAPMRAIVAESVDQPRFLAVLTGTFAALALALAVVGIYGVVAYSVAQRTREIGVRVALGARPGDVFALVIRDGLTLTFAGMALGIAAAVAVTSSLQSLLFGVEPVDPLTFALTSLGLALVAAVACALPARRATEVDPVVALRAD